MRDYIERQAKKLVRKHNTRNPFELAYALNINVRFYDFKKLKGFYTYYKRNRYIGINRNLSEIERMLCCAHEIGHDQLHRHLTYYMKDYDFFSNIKTEYQANLIAAYLLIPDYLLDKYANSDLTIEQIAAIENLYPDLIRLRFNLDAL